MEETFLRVKNERDELIKKHNRDSTDGKTTTTTSVTSPSTITAVTEEIANLKMELKRQKTHYEAQFIEYVSVDASSSIFFLPLSTCNYSLILHALLARF